jgi:hypothetical protein
MVTVKYSANNSGGYWWLEDDDWKNLEAAGWNVEWEKERWLGALAKGASKEFPDAETGIREWEEITGGNSAAEGCNCCGPPHSFSYEDENGEYHYSSVRVLNTGLAWY